MPNKILYESKHYKLTPSNFTYQGHTEPLKNIADLYVVENGRKEKLIAGLTLGLWGISFAFFGGNIVSVFMTTLLISNNKHPDISNIQTISLLLFFAVFFTIGYFIRSKHRLFITKANGAKGSTDRNRKSREEFDKLISAVKMAISEHC